ALHPAPPRTASNPGGAGANGPAGPEWADPFSAGDGWRMGGTPAWTVRHFRLPGQEPVIIRTRRRGEVVEFALDGGDQPQQAPQQAPPAIEARGPGQGTGGPAAGRIVSRTADHLTIELDGVTHTFSHASSPEGTWLGRDGDSWHLQDHDPVAAALGGRGHAGADTLAAPMPGTVTVVKVAVGERVAAGQSLLVVEAMKMEHVISAPHAGTVTELDVSPGTTVAMDQVLAVVTPEAEEEGA
ncbi:biotin/lipoyl-binding protein, partial [Streptomyces sp. BR123]|uniref:acetyl-CoA carboxylase biotin carboxyl carrier protein subunit n=1 Tax=Streptomyces sp. BR123 TaxID=2749828 RepID=UPI0015C42EB9